MRKSRSVFVSVGKNKGYLWNLGSSEALTQRNPEVKEWNYIVNGSESAGSLSSDFQH